MQTMTKIASTLAQVAIRETTDSPTGSNFHAYVDGYYHCSCASRDEAKALIAARFPGALVAS